jgi:type VI secretion system secreted protein Hcp
MSQEEANRLVRAAERLRRSRHLGLKLGLPTAAAFGAGAALAVGAIPGTDGTITGCYITNPDGARYGELRVIDPSQPATLPGAGGPNERAVCLGDERTITWNQRGPQGPPGPQGAQGPPGSAGANGAQGANGAPLIGQTTFGFSGGGKTFLKLDGIKGESLDKTHKDEIEIDSFSFSASSSGSGGGSGAATGKTISSFTITKKLDKASPALFQAAADGKHIKLADVTFERKAGRGQQEFLVIKLEDVLISSVQQGSGGGGAKEQVTFAFHKATETFLGANHKALQTVTINVGTNKKA